MSRKRKDKVQTIGAPRLMRKPNKYEDRSKYEGDGTIKRVKYGEGRRG